MAGPRIPDAPSGASFSQISQTSLTVSWTQNFNGGAVILAYELGYGLSSSAPTTIISAMFPKTITDLLPGTKYYFWVRALNVVGWGPWSLPKSAMTIAGARVQVGLSWKFAVPYVRDGGVWKLARPWVRDLGVWKETQ